MTSKTHDAAHTPAALFRVGKPMRGKGRNNAMKDAVPVTMLMTTRNPPNCGSLQSIGSETGRQQW